ncbi:MAG: ribonuclease Z [Verrucomicrobiaceae bacterium]|nr:ribonuclease Z [Verrucomicrobiaceae bacterium]
MAIEWKVLGRAGADNALHVVVDSGVARESFLFDCGEGVLESLRAGEVKAVSHLAFSHFHMDHVAGFDGFFRINYNRSDAPVTVWGPAGTVELMGHRFRGFVWNLHADQEGEWIVREIGKTALGTARYLTREAFTPAHRQPDQPREGTLLHRGASWRLEGRLLPHGLIDSVAYRLAESPRLNIDAAAMKRNDYLPGPWLRRIVDATADEEETLVEVAGRSLRVGELRRELLVTTPGMSLAYLTDFRVEPDSPAWEELVTWLSGTTVLVCECQYRAADYTLARQNAHMTADLVGRLAAEAGVGRLILHHLSRRYSSEDWRQMRSEAAAFFPRTELPVEWGLS